MRQARGQKRFSFPNKWGGNRKHNWSAKQKRRGKLVSVPHRRRALLASRYPVHVTVRLREGLASMRRPRTFAVVRQALAEGKNRFGFRLNHFSVQSNHLHLIVEAKDRRALSRGMQGLAIRIAKALNRLWKRTGRVWAERYHDVVLRSGQQVRNALLYVLQNSRHHRVPLSKGESSSEPDPFSSGQYFNGWRGLSTPLSEPPPVAEAHTYLQRTHWRRYGLLRLNELPR